MRNIISDVGCDLVLSKTLGRLGHKMDTSATSPLLIVISDDEEMQPEVVDITPSTLKTEGNAFFARKKYDEALLKYTAAIEELEKIIPATIDHAAYYGNRAAAYIMLEQYEKALSDCQKSVKIDPNNNKGYRRMLKCKAMLGDYSGAKLLLVKCKDICGSDASFASEISNIEGIIKLADDSDISMEKLDYRRVLFFMDRLLSQGVKAYSCKVRKAECCAYLGRYQEAQELANSVLVLDRQNADALYVRGLCLYYENNIDQAVTHFQRVLKLAPDHARAHKYYRLARSVKQKKEEGNAEFKAVRLQEAYTLYTEALAIDPDLTITNAKLYYNRALVCSKLSKHNDAVADCTAALNLDPKYCKALLKRAQCHMDLEDYEEAIKDFEKLVQLDGSRINRRLLLDAKNELKKSKRKDYYKILGISKTATDDEIKKAYRKRALVHHPDRHSSASEKERVEQEKQFKEVGEAYGVLSDPKKRQKYDHGQDIEDMDFGPDCQMFYHPFFRDSFQFPFQYS